MWKIDICLYTVIDGIVKTIKWNYSIYVI
jgi:hypothetical protein